MRYIEYKFRMGEYGIKLDNEDLISEYTSDNFPETFNLNVFFFPESIDPKVTCKTTIPASSKNIKKVAATILTYLQEYHLEIPPVVSLEHFKIECPNTPKTEDCLDCLISRPHLDSEDRLLVRKVVEGFVTIKRRFYPSNAYNFIKKIESSKLPYERG